MSWVSVVVLVAVVASLVHAIAGRDGLAQSWKLARELRLRPFLTNLAPIAAVLASAVGLYQLPWMQWGWWTLISGTPGNVMVSSATGSLWVFVLLAVAMPQLVAGEERLFRAGTRSWAQAVVRSVVFGLAHLVSGVPIAAGLALSIAGLWFTRQYFRAAASNAPPPITSRGTTSSSPWSRSR